MIRSIIVFAFSAFITFTFSACKKETPPTGEYWIYLTYDGGYEDGGPVEITESNKNTVVINGAELVKDGKRVKGPMSGSPFVMGTLIIDGEWSNKLFSKDYKIEGEFEEIVQNPNGHYHSYGAFTIKKPD